MPSKRPSPSAMETDGASSSPSRSPPGSRMRSSRARFRLDDRRPEPSPSPRDSSRKSDRKRRRRASPESAAVTAPSERRPRALQDSASPSARRPRAFQEAAALAVLAAGAARAAPGARSYGAVQRLWSNADELALLTGAAAFRARNGHVPRLPDMGALYEYLRGSIAPHLDQDKVYYKLKRLKSKFQHVAPSAAAGKHELRVRDLCTKVWGPHFGLPSEDDEPEEEEPSERRTVPDAAAMLPVATEVLDAYWKTNGLAGVSLEKGLSLLGTEAARSIEARWRRQLDAEVRSQMRRHDLAKDVYGLLLDAIKGLGP